MKKLFSAVLLSFILNGMFAETEKISFYNTTIEIKYDEETPDIWVSVGNDNNYDSYLIEAIGPDCRVESVFTDVINNKKILFLKVYLGNPGGRQSIDFQELYVFKILEKNRICLVLKRELVNKRFSVASDSFTSFKVYSYIYNSESKEILIYNSKNYKFTEVERINLKELIE